MDLEINKKWQTKTENGYIPSRSGEYRNEDAEMLIKEVERLRNWNEGYEQLAIDHYKLEKEIKALQESLILNSNLVVKYEEALREIDTHIRSTKDPVPYIVETLKRTLPEYE